MTEDVKPYYQTTVSKTIFYPEDADPDDYGLEDYRKDEVRAVRDFVRSESNLLIIGGVSASGKTHLLHEVRNVDSFDYYDLQGLKKHSPLIEPGCSDIYGCVNDMVANVYNRPGWMTEPKGIILDEGIVLANKETDDNLRALIDELLRRYSKVIISGGGAQYTGVEQSEIIAGCMPADARIEKLIMTIKTFNSVQGAEFLMERSKELGIGMSPEVAKAIAESMVPYFNMPRVLYRLACYPDESGKYKIHSDGVITSGIMPKEVYDPMWQKQVEIWKEKGLKDPYKIERFAVLLKSHQVEKMTEETLYGEASIKTVSEIARLEYMLNDLQKTQGSSGSPESHMEHSELTDIRGGLRRLLDP